MEKLTIRDWFRTQLSTSAPHFDDGADSSRVFPPARLGELALAQFQQVAVQRGLKNARAFGGVILADAVGLGKTRVGLAIAAALRRDQRLLGTPNTRAPDTGAPILCCVPARLKDQWQRAAGLANIHDFRLISHTFLSRAEADDFIQQISPSVVLVDEAHRFRNPGARRTRRLAMLGAKAPLVLATATPVCNGIWDLYHLFRLFLAEHDLREACAHQLHDAFKLANTGQFDLTELVELLVIRRLDAPDPRGFGRRPDLKFQTLTYQASPDEAWLWQHLASALSALSLELFRHDWPRQLWLEYMLKRWESGTDALYATLVEMADFHRRWLQANRAGKHLGRKTFRELFGREFLDFARHGQALSAGSRQEVFSFLYDASPAAACLAQTAHDLEYPPTPELLDAKKVLADHEHLKNLADRCARIVRGGGDKRARLLAEIRENDQKYLIFTGFQHSARGLFAYLTQNLGLNARIGLVTGSGARATGLGRAPASELVWRFAPRSNAHAALPEHQQIRILISTDCLAEGVNLQDCHRVVLFDLPYSPLVVEQRIGRLLRPGAQHQVATVYLLRPERWADSLGLQRRLGQKIRGADSAGAGFIAAAELSTPPIHLSNAPTHLPNAPTNPLAALTRLDALSATLTREAPANKQLQQGFWRAQIQGATPGLWLRIRSQTPDGRATTAWCHASSASPPTMRMSQLIDKLIRDAAQMARIEPIEAKDVDTELFQPAIQTIHAREKLLRAARLAPYPLRLDAPQRLLWAKIQQYAEKSQISIDADDLSKIRHRLLRAHPRGVERNLHTLATSQLPPTRLVARVQTLLADAPIWQPDVKLEIIAGLLISPDS